MLSKRSTRMSSVSLSTTCTRHSSMHCWPSETSPFRKPLGQTRVFSRYRENTRVCPRGFLKGEVSLGQQCIDECRVQVVDSETDDILVLRFDSIASQAGRLHSRLPLVG